MPQPHWKEGLYPRTHQLTLAAAAKDGAIIQVRCGICRRVTRFLASDLVTVLDPRRHAHAPPFGCSRCGTDEHIAVKLHYPAPADYGHLLIRRPAGMQQLWKTVRLGDAV